MIRRSKWGEAIDYAAHWMLRRYDKPEFVNRLANQNILQFAVAGKASCLGVKPKSREDGSGFNATRLASKHAY